MTLIAALCLLLGWMVTTVLGPGDSLQDFDDSSYDVASAGVLNDPSGFGTHQQAEKRPGIVDDEEDEDKDKDSIKYHSKEHSVSGALVDLHHAVSDKIQSWNPYFVKSSHHKGSALANKATTTKDSKNATWSGESVSDGIKEDDLLGARVRVGKCTILFNGNGIWERAVRTHEVHDRQHGYRLHILRQDLMDDVWSKPAYILSLILRELAKPKGERLDWLFWVDADTIILNPYVPIETFLPPSGTEFDDVYLMYSNDWNGLNNGVFPIRVNQWSANFFAAIVSYRHYKPEVPLQFRDQSAMNNLMQEPAFAKHVLQVPQRWFNAYQGEHNETLQPFSVRRGDLLVHFAGVIPREERMEHWLERAEQHLDDWEMPVKSTSYPQEARDFWSEQKGLRRNNALKLQETRENAAKLMTTTDQRLNDYGDRLNDEQKAKISQQREELKKILEHEVYREEPAKIEEGMKNLSEAVSSLTSTITEANKLLLQSAHEAIFAGEKDLLDGGFHQGTTNPELEQISTNVQSLKTLIMAPEDSWNRHDITTATNSLTEARAKLQEKLDAEIAAEKKAEEEQAAQVKVLEDARKAAEAEAAGAQGLVPANAVETTAMEQDAAAQGSPTITEIEVTSTTGVIAPTPAAAEENV